jgi:phosphopantetheinyl transferase (holo-ACP synthase)
MVGNDVIDLGDPEARPAGCHARFDARVFAPDELELLLASAAPVRLRWILWAAKEAAFKVAKKLDAATVFSPRRFVVQPASDVAALVVHADQRYAVALEIAPRHVHAVATDAGALDTRVVARVERLGWGSATCPGSAARALAIGTVAPLLGVAATDLAVLRDGRVPRVVCIRKRFTVDLSLSHHGRFVAFACTLPAVHASVEEAP